MENSTDKKHRIFLLGASGHAKVIIDILKSQSIRPAGLIDQNPSIKELLQYTVSDSLEEAGFLTGDLLLLSIGNNSIRKRVAEKNSVEYFTAIHISAVISEFVVIGEGTVVMPNVSVNADARIGKHCILNTNCSIDHDCVLNDFVHISPNAALAGNVIVEEGTHIGIGASVIQNIKIGKWVTVGAGAVVIRDIPDYATVVGNPGTIIKYNKS